MADPIDLQEVYTKIDNQEPINQEELDAVNSDVAAKKTDPAYDSSTTKYGDDAKLSEAKVTEAIARGTEENLELVISPMAHLSQQGMQKIYIIRYRLKRKRNFIKAG